MAVKASGSITLAAVTDVSAVTPYYKAQTSTLSPPNKPTTVPPSGWSATQPAVNTSNTCYIVWLMEYSNGTWGYSDVSTFSEYEAAKAAQQTADSALSVAEATNQYFWFTSTGSDAGAHVTQVPKDTFEVTPSGGNVKMTSTAMQIRDALNVLASFAAGGVQIGEDTKQHITIGNSAIEFFAVERQTGGPTLSIISFNNDNGDFPVPTFIEASNNANSGLTFHGPTIQQSAATSQTVFLSDSVLGLKTVLEGGYEGGSASYSLVGGRHLASTGDADEDILQKTIYSADGSSSTQFSGPLDASAYSVGSVNIVDHVIEQGHIGGWSYRKWASGVAECSGYTSVISVAYTNQWGSAYYSDEKFFDFPIAFKSGTYPAVTCTVWDNGGLGWATIKTLNYLRVGFYLSNPAKTTRSTQLYIHANGFWK